MNPKYYQFESYSKSGDSWIESEYSHVKYSLEEMDYIYRAFRGMTNKNVHMVEDNLTCEYSGLPSVRFYDDN
jgi:hypothetical protein